MDYLEWLVRHVCQDDREQESYQKLFYAMLSTTFVAYIDNDENRSADGMALRLIFEDETGIGCDMIGPCSVLEMMVAMAIRCENDIMYDPDEGDRTSVWFWEMMDNLGLIPMDDWGFDWQEFEETMDRLNNRTYGKDGFGGPFYIAGFDQDMRKIELWYQMNYYICAKFSW
jgi:hypothetical protein